MATVYSVPHGGEFGPAYFATMAEAVELARKLAPHEPYETTVEKCTVTSRYKGNAFCALLLNGANWCAATEVVWSSEKNAA